MAYQLILQENSEDKVIYDELQDREVIRSKIIRNSTYLRRKSKEGWRWHSMFLQTK